MVQDINDRHGADFSVAIEVGSDPDAVGLSCMWETMGAYEAYRESQMADEDLNARITENASLITLQTDRIARVLAAPGERAPFSVVNEARMHMPRIAEAIPLALEVCAMVEAKVGTKTGFIVSMTGDRSVVAWISRHATLDGAASDNETLEADPEYLEMFKRADGVFVDGSLTQTIYHRVL